MLSYKEFMSLLICEGIIKVDKELLSFLESTFIVDFFDRFKSQIKNKEALTLIDSFLTQYEKVHQEYTTKNNIKQLDKTYLSLVYDNNNVYGKFNYHVGTKALDDNNAASFHRSNNGSLSSIRVAFDKKFLMDFNRWLSSPKLETLTDLFSEKRNQIEHELAHMVEWFIVTRKIKGVKGGYNDNEEDYFTSEIEFEPMIVSLVRNFELMVKKYKNKNGTPMSVDTYKELAKDILNGEQYEEIDNVFMMHSKNITPVKYKRAAKKAYVEIIDNIETLKKEGYLK